MEVHIGEDDKYGLDEDGDMRDDLAMAALAADAKSDGDLSDECYIDSCDEEFDEQDVDELVMPFDPAVDFDDDRFSYHPATAEVRFAWCDHGGHS